MKRKRGNDDVSLSYDDSARHRALTDQTISMMAWMPEFNFLTRQEVARLAEMPPHTFKRGEALIDPADNSQRILIILLAGECVIEKKVEINGETFAVNIETVHAPAVLGEIGVFSSVHRTATVLASQRSVVLLVPAETLTGYFEQSKETTKKMLWYFAKLGVMRIKTSTLSYDSLFRKYIKNESIKPHDFTKDVTALEEILGNDVEASNISSSFFDPVANLLDRVDKALGEVTYLDQIKDQPMPDIQQAPPTCINNLSLLARSVMKSGKYEGVPIKKALSEEFAKNLNLFTKDDSAKECIDIITGATYDLVDLSRTIKEANSKRTTKPGTQNMIDGFEKRMKTAFDDTVYQAKERFSVDKLPIRLGNDLQSVILARYLVKKIAEIKARVQTEHFEDLTNIEYTKPGIEARDSVAMEIYGRLSDHIIVQLLIPAIIENKMRYFASEYPKDSSILDFLILGYNLHYPPKKKTAQENQSPPYPV